MERRLTDGSVRYVGWDPELELSLREGVLRRFVRFRDQSSREFTIESCRLVHMEHEHTAAIDWVLTPINWSGVIEVRSGIDGGVTNAGVARYRQLDGRHLELLDRGSAAEDVVFLVARSRQSRIEVAQAVRTRVTIDGAPCGEEARTETNGAWVARTITLRCERHAPVRVERAVADDIQGGRRRRAFTWAP